MPYSFDFFVAELTCPNCKTASPADTSTNAQTYIRDSPEGASLNVGSALTIDRNRIRDNDYDGYRTVQTPLPDEPIRILNTWDCYFCDQPVQWMEIVVADNVIASITAIDFDREHFMQSHLVSVDADGIAADLAGIPYRELPGHDIVQILREKLPSSSV